MSIKSELEQYTNGTMWDEIRDCGLVQLNADQISLIEAYRGYHVTLSTIKTFLVGEPIKFGLKAVTL